MLSLGFAKTIDGIVIYTNFAPVISISIAVCLFFMMYPIMVKSDFAEVLQAGRNAKPVVCHTFREESKESAVVRIYSARRATRRERRQHEE